MRLALLALVACVAGSGCAQSTRVASGAWTGSFRLPASADPVTVSVELRGTSAVVSMGYGHPARSRVAVQTSRGSAARFELPGLPANVVFAGTVRGNTFEGDVTQGALRGTFRLARGDSQTLPLFGLYRSPAGDAVAVVRATGFAPWLVELPSGRVHGIGPSLTVGSRLGDASGAGRLARTATGLSWRGARYDRVPLRQLEVRVGADAATLTLPPGRGPFPAVAMVHGAGPQTREEFQVFSAYCALLGIAVLADDKRGVGQSTGLYPGEAATSTSLGELARDARAEVGFLRSLPQIDAHRVGLFGDSQAGWIVALAAARDPGVRWAVVLAGSTVTVGETDLFASLAGQSRQQPSGARAGLIARVRAQGPAGFDPRPFLERLSIPTYWVFGSDDRNVPTELCVEALEALPDRRDDSWVVLPVTHALLELPTGLYSSLPRSRGFTPRLYPTVGRWLRTHVT